MQVGGQYVPDNVELGGPWVCPTPPEYTAANETCDPCGDGRPNPYWGEFSVREEAPAHSADIWHTTLEGKALKQIWCAVHIYLIKGIDADDRDVRVT